MHYAHPEALVTSDWLAANLADPRVRVLDASFTLPGVSPTARENYDRGHIPVRCFSTSTISPHLIPVCRI